MPFSINKGNNINKEIVFEGGKAMRKQLAKAGSLILALSMVLSGSAIVNAADAAPAEEQVLSISLNNEPAALDPQVNNSGNASQIVSALHEPMLRKVNDEQGWEPALMTDYSANDDFTVHTLTLREGAKWSDGSDITVDDILYSFERVLTPDLGSEIAYKYYIIENAEKFYTGECGFDEVGVKADGNTITFTTAEPCDYFIDLLTGTMFSPVQKAAAEEFGDTYGTDVDKTISSGPFKMEEWVHDSTITLIKNEEYWDAENVKLEKIDIVLTSDNNTLQGMYENDELSILEVAENLVSQYEGRDDTVLMKNLLLKNSFIEFNPNNNEFLANLKIREALSIAFDRKLFASQVMGNPDVAAYGLVPFGIKGLDGGDFREQQGEIIKDAEDASEIERAKQLLTEGLEEVGKTLEDMEQGFTIQCLESGKVQAQAIQAMWKQNLGLEMQVSVLDFNVILPMLIEGTFDCVIGGGQDSEYRDPQGFMQFIYDEGKWDNDEFKALVEKAHTQTGNDRIQTWMDIERMVLTNYVYIPQVYEQNNWAVKSNVSGLRMFNYGYEFDYKYVVIMA